MSQVLDADMWLVSDACPKLIECLPTLIRDPDDAENVLKVDYAAGDTIGDDPADSARYGLQYMLREPSVPVEVRAAELVKDVTDPTLRVLKLDKFYADEAQKNQPVPIARRHSVKRKFGF